MSNSHGDESVRSHPSSSPMFRSSKRAAQAKWIWILPVVVGLGMLVYSLWLTWGELRYITQSKTVVGVVSGKEQTTRLCGGRSGTTNCHDYYLEYMFKLGDGREIGGKSAVSEEKYDITEAGDSVAIQYIDD